ncbi:MAG TPA: hypothetical protein VFD58_34545 [Blastocatellia bacterium]|nr:hypothetical protein [Blastocatellia bacterium]
MKKQFAVLTLLIAGAVSVISPGARSAGAPSLNPADYPYMNMISPRSTNLSATACANSAQEALKKSGFTHIGSGHPGYGLFGSQGAYVAGVAWDADLHSYFLVVAGPDKATADNNLNTLEGHAKALFEK